VRRGPGGVDPFYRAPAEAPQTTRRTAGSDVFNTQQTYVSHDNGMGSTRWPNKPLLAEDSSSFTLQAMETRSRDGAGVALLTLGVGTVADAGRSRPPCQRALLGSRCAPRPGPMAPGVFTYAYGGARRLSRGRLPMVFRHRGASWV